MLKNSLWARFGSAQEISRKAFQSVFCRSEKLTFTLVPTETRARVHANTCKKCFCPLRRSKRADLS